MATMIKIGSWHVDVDDIGIIKQPYQHGDNKKWRVFYDMKQSSDFTTDHNSRDEAQAEINYVLRLKGLLTESVGTL